VRVLLITHEASLSGAPRVASLVAHALSEHGHAVQVVSRRTGPLLAAFRETAPTRLEPLYRVRRRLWCTPVLRLIAPLVDTALAAATIVRSRADVVYVNSTSAAVYLRPALWLRRPVVIHAHESGEIAGRFLGRVRSLPLLRRARLIACSPSVQASLAEITGLPAAGIVMLPSVPDGSRIQVLAEAEPDHAYPPGVTVVGCCGAVESRKGADLWLEAMRLVRRALPGTPVEFAWVGEVVDHDLVATAPDGVFLGPSTNPYAHMKRFDIATLPSRDDPFPLVVLEAMTVGTPVVGFGVGGVADQIGDAGVVVPPEDVAAFAGAIVGLVLDGRRRDDLGERARERVRARYSLKVFADGVTQVVEETAGSATVPPR
jgi:glycosyltransferase involved in cell wall biosynthesis